jgi:glycyl-tRNA synthetase
MPEMAKRLADELRRDFPVFYDESGAIGRRYRRQDEVGTPFGLTIDGQSTTDHTVTIRDRDTLQQERIDAARVADVLRERLAT